MTVPWLTAKGQGKADPPAVQGCLPALLGPLDHDSPLRLPNRGPTTLLPTQVTAEVPTSASLRPFLIPSSPANDRVPGKPGENTPPTSSVIKPPVFLRYLPRQVQTAQCDTVSRSPEPPSRLCRPFSPRTPSLGETYAPPQMQRTAPSTCRDFVSLSIIFKKAELDSSKYKIDRC